MQLWVIWIHWRHINTLSCRWLKWIPITSDFHYLLPISSLNISESKYLKLHLLRCHFKGSLPSITHSPPLPRNTVPPSPWPISSIARIVYNKATCSARGGGEVHIHRKGRDYSQERGGIGGGGGGGEGGGGGVGDVLKYYMVLAKPLCDQVTIT